MKRQQAIIPQHFVRHNSRLLWRFGAIIVMTASVALGCVRSANAQEVSSEAAMAKYADAANFQTGGAFDLAIEAWEQFLSDAPQHPLAAQAAHFLGVCHMQKERPEYGKAIQAFRRALQNPEYDLREESLANLGWCLYASAGQGEQGEQRDPVMLRESIDAFEKLQTENPQSKFLDRAYFYSGEAAYGLGDSKRAIEFYDKLLAMSDAKNSPLRCDAIYARGVAQEELKAFDAALASYRQLLGSCQREELVTDVHLRVGDLLVMKKDYEEAIESFVAAFDSTRSSEDRAYAIFREAFALVQANRPTEAATKYDQLLNEFPQSPYAGSALLASAQSSYRGGDLEGAGERFRRVLEQNNLDAATEAAHWLATIEINKGNPQSAAAIARQQLERGVTGSFAMNVRLDLAESLSKDPETIAESRKQFLEAYRNDLENSLAPRALYNAAFLSLQINEPDRALELASEFIDKFPQDPLLPDVRFIAAECHLMRSDASKASDLYEQILTSTSRDNPQRPFWLLRAASANNAAGRFQQTIDQLTEESNLFEQPSQQGEVFLLIGMAQLKQGQFEEAAKSFLASRNADPNWSRAVEAQLQEGQAQLKAGNPVEADSIWQTLIDSYPDSPVADQARYQIAQLANRDEQYERAVNYYNQILRSGNESSLVLYAQYGKGWALMQMQQFGPALESLQLVMDNPSHPLRNDALLARGITLRNLGQVDAAKTDLEQYLELPPTGTNLGHALYELALIDQTAMLPGKAAEKLQRLVEEVPDYPSMDKVLYELGWSLQENGNVPDAVKYFSSLVSRYPDTSLVADAAYFIGQQHFSAENWAAAASQFEIAAEKAQEADLAEKAYYRLGWSLFKDEQFEKAEQAFAGQADKYADGKFAMDALMMIGECRFKQGDYESALEGFQVARDRIQRLNEDSKSIRDESERRVRELVLLHGGQSAAQLKEWKKAIQWYDELRRRFPSTQYLPQVFYETGFAYQQSDDNDSALQYYQEVANNYRNELAARARFMMGEIYFLEREFDKAIPEFQRVMYGFGAEKAPEGIKNWQAKSAFEAGRCGELLLETANTPANRQKAQEIASDFYNYVLEKHPAHELAAKSRDRIEALKQ